MAEPITWTNITLTLDELDPWPRNPRQIKGEQVTRLEESYDEFGEVEPIAVGPKGENKKYPLYNGHQRYFVLKAKHGGGFEVDARLSSRPLTEKEREKLTVYLHKGAAGEWNFDVLSEWDVPDLLNWGFDETELGITPDDNEWANAMGGLPDEDRAPFQQMTFTLHDTQAETVKEALAAAKGLGAFVETQNENSNGNALARICEMFLEANGRS